MQDTIQYPINNFISMLNDFFYGVFNLPTTEFNKIERCMGAAYIMLGAHLMGGPKNKKHLEAAGYKCSHLDYKEGNRQLAKEVLFSLRDKPKLADTANKFFYMMKDIMDKIE